MSFFSSRRFAATVAALSPLRSHRLKDGTGGGDVLRPDRRDLEKRHLRNKCFKASRNNVQIEGTEPLCLNLPWPMTTVRIARRAVAHVGFLTIVPDGLLVVHLNVAHVLPVGCLLRAVHPVRTRDPRLFSTKHDLIGRGQVRITRSS